MVNGRPVAREDRVYTQQKGQVLFSCPPFPLPLPLPFPLSSTIGTLLAHLVCFDAPRVREWGRIHGQQPAARVVSPLQYCMYV